jgi:exopolysaccharide biosynthesis polyprenyl glycosylphosphotransferase
VPATLQVVVAALAMVVVFTFSGLYARRHIRHSLRRLARGFAVTIIVWALLAYLGDSQLGRSSLAVAAAATIVFSVSGRYLLDWLIARIYPLGELLGVLVVGDPVSCLHARELIEQTDGGHAYRVFGMISDASPDESWQAEHGLATVARLAELEEAVRALEPAEILVADPGVAKAFMPELVDLCRRRRLTLKVAADAFDAGAAPVCFLPGYGLPLFAIRPHSLSGYDYYVKRVGDVLAGALLLVLLSPVLALIALAIKLDSRGPVLFVDRRIGFGQRVFRCYKFRTMRRDAQEMQADLEELNEAGGAIFKIRDDPRVTRAGRLLRRTSLDELPQLFNVVRGQMSLVGPRPLPERDFALLDEVHKQRHVVLPGITGLWQVSGRSDLSFDDMIELDLRYIETWSLGSDVMILLRTVGAVFGVRGAY